jgi:hypothetical protein
MAKAKPTSKPDEEQPQVFDLEEIRRQLREAEQKVLGPLDQELTRLKAVRDDAERQIFELEKIKAKVNGTTVKASTASTGKRAKRADLEQAAADMISFIKSKGKEGTSGSEIKAQFPNVKYQSAEKFLEQYGQKGNFKSEGKAKGKKYFA